MCRQPTIYTYLKARNTRTHTGHKKVDFACHSLSAHSGTLCRWLAGIRQNKFSFPSNYSTLAQAHTEFGEIKQRKKKKKQLYYARLCDAQCKYVFVSFTYRFTPAASVAANSFCVDVCSRIYVRQNKWVNSSFFSRFSSPCPLGFGAFVSVT